MDQHFLNRNKLQNCPLFVKKYFEEVFEEIPQEINRERSLLQDGDDVDVTLSHYSDIFNLKFIFPVISSGFILLTEGTFLS